MRLLAIVSALLLVTSLTAAEIKPPKGLEWGMSLREVVSQMKDTHNIKSKKNHQKLGKYLIDYTVLTAPENWHRLGFNKFKLMKRKTEKTFALFNENDSLVAFQYIFKWNNSTKDEGFTSANKGMRQSWEFFDRVFTVLNERYGEPLESEATELTRRTEIPSGKTFDIVWTDEFGNTITLVATRQVHSFLVAKEDRYYVFIAYSHVAPNIVNDIEVSDDDL